MSDPDVQRKAEEFLQGQQLYYRSLKAHRDELKRYKESRAEHQAAVQLLSDLPDKVGIHVTQTRTIGLASSCRGGRSSAGRASPPAR
jgi:hypothetical protein